MERNRRVAKAYARAPTLSINGSDDGFDGYQIGLNGFDNPLRDPKTDMVKQHIGDVSMKVVILRRQFINDNYRSGQTKWCLMNIWLTFLISNQNKNNSNKSIVELLARLKWNNRNNRVPDSYWLRIWFINNRSLGYSGIFPSIIIGKRHVLKIKNLKSIKFFKLNFFFGWQTEMKFVTIYFF